MEEDAALFQDFFNALEGSTNDQSSQNQNPTTNDQNLQTTDEVVQNPQTGETIIQNEQNNNELNEEQIRQMLEGEDIFNIEEPPTVPESENRILPNSIHLNERTNIVTDLIKVISYSITYKNNLLNDVGLFSIKISDIIKSDVIFSNFIDFLTREGNRNDNITFKIDELNYLNSESFGLAKKIKISNSFLPEMLIIDNISSLITSDLSIDEKKKKIDEIENFYYFCETPNIKVTEGLVKNVFSNPKNFSDPNLNQITQQLIDLFTEINNFDLGPQSDKILIPIFVPIEDLTQDISEIIIDKETEIDKIKHSQSKNAILLTGNNELKLYSFWLLNTFNKVDIELLGDANVSQLWNYLLSNYVINTNGNINEKLFSESFNIIFDHVNKNRPSFLIEHVQNNGDIDLTDINSVKSTNQNLKVYRNITRQVDKLTNNLMNNNYPANGISYFSSFSNFSTNDPVLHINLNDNPIVSDIPVYHEIERISQPENIPQTPNDFEITNIRKKRVLLKIKNNFYTKHMLQYESLRSFQLYKDIIKSGGNININDTFDLSKSEQYNLITFIPSYNKNNIKNRIDIEKLLDYFPSKLIYNKNETRLFGKFSIRDFDPNQNGELKFGATDNVMYVSHVKATKNFLTTFPQVFSYVLFSNNTLWDFSIKKFSKVITVDNDANTNNIIKKRNESLLKFYLLWNIKLSGDKLNEFIGKISNNNIIIGNIYSVFSQIVDTLEIMINETNVSKVLVSFDFSNKQLFTFDYFKTLINENKPTNIRPDDVILQDYNGFSINKIKFIVNTDNSEIYIKYNENKISDIMAGNNSLSQIENVFIENCIKVLKYLYLNMSFI